MHATEKKQESIPTLIAWLSTCLLAAGMGMADRFTHVLWLQAGSFGLVAAVGLDVSARMRWRRQRQKHWRTVEKRWDRSLEQFVAQRDVVDELRADAVGQLLSASPREARNGIRKESRDLSAICQSRFTPCAAARDRPRRRPTRSASSDGWTIYPTRDSA